MSIILTHNFRDQCFNRDELFSSMDKVVKGVPVKGEMVASKCTVFNYMEKVKEQANGKSNNLPNGFTHFGPDKYIGNGFEILVECIIKEMGKNPLIGIVDYEPILFDDNGVDGLGKCTLDMKPSTVQVKYRSNPNDLLSAEKDRLNSFVLRSLIHHNIKLNDKHKKMLVITTAHDIAPHTKEVTFNNNVYCLGNKWLSKNIDGNLAFWITFRNAMGA